MNDNMNVGSTFYGYPLPTLLKEKLFNGLKKGVLPVVIQVINVFFAILEYV